MNVKVCQSINKSLHAQGAHTVKGVANALLLLFAWPYIGINMYHTAFHV